jgi:hypothetical protein
MHARFAGAANRVVPLAAAAGLSDMFFTILMSAGEWLTADERLLVRSSV